MIAARGIKVVVVDDDQFTVSLVAGGLESLGFQVFSSATPEDAWRHIVEEEPNALVADLDLGRNVSGLDLLRRVREAYPWVGLVALTTHQAPELAVGDGRLPEDAVYLVKSAVKRVEDIGEGVVGAISGRESSPTAGDEELPRITRSQAEVLRMLAGGASTRAVAESRGTSVRAAETMLVRLYAALGIAPDSTINPRVEAVRLWQLGRVRVR